VFLLNELRNKNILLISPEFWGETFVSKHHIALELSKIGNKVFFLNPSSWHLGFNIKSTKFSKNLRIIDYGTLFKGLNRLPFSARIKIHNYLARRIQDYLKTNFDVVWNFDPYHFQYLPCFGAHLNIYHSVDVYNTNLEKETAETANIVFTTSDKILERLQDVRTPKFKINHGVAQHFFDENTDLFKQEETPNRIKVGYIGNLMYKYLDVDILGTIIDNNKDMSFTFIGPYEKSNLHGGEYNLKFIEYLKNSTNVQMLGPKPSIELPWYLNQFDLFIMCYSGDRNIAEMANPHKILEYLSTGKTVICHYIDEYKNKRNLVEMVDDNNLIPQRFNKVIHNLSYYNSTEKARIRIQYALDNTYIKQINRIERLVSDYNSPASDMDSKRVQWSTSRLGK